jgi:hypothetical protein
MAESSSRGPNEHLIPCWTINLDVTDIEPSRAFMEYGRAHCAHVSFIPSLKRLFH